ncbi:MAG TPA: helix-turn-helix domain-containing protein, partial [Thermoanaerobaculia bacterium]|nr:helix-turn-helix domain-containing protein [Thermoanaerobaculia bacterium]
MAQATDPPWSEALVILRALRGCSRPELAAAAGVKLSALESYERGGEKPPEETLRRLAEAMGFGASFFARTVSFVAWARALAASGGPDAGEDGRRARVAAAAAEFGSWFEELTRAGLTRAATEPAAAPAGAPEATAQSVAGPAARRGGGNRPARPPWGKVLTILRQVRRMSQAELERAAGLPAGALSDYERDRYAPRSEVFERLLAAMAMPLAVVDRALALVESAWLAREGRGQAAAGERLRAAIDDLAGEEGRAMEDFARARLGRLAVAARFLVERREAPALWERLEGLSHAGRRALVSEAAEFQTAGLCELLCEKSVEAAHDSAAWAARLAGLGVRAARRVEGGEGWRARVVGNALFHFANAARVGGHLPRAEKALAPASAHWQAGAGADPGLLNAARILQIEASLRREKRDLTEAIALFDQALAADRWGETASLLIGKAKTLEELGKYEEAIALLRQAGSRIDRERDVWRYFVVRTNLAVNLCLLGRHGQAALLLPEVRLLAAGLGKRLETVRVLWLQGKVAAGLGRVEEAISLLQRVRGEFLAQGIAYDAALARISQCAVQRRRFPVGAKPTRQLVAPAGSNRSGGGGDEAIGASGVE